MYRWTQTYKLLSLSLVCQELKKLCLPVEEKFWWVCLICSSVEISWGKFQRVVSGRIFASLCERQLIKKILSKWATKSQKFSKLLLFSFFDIKSLIFYILLFRLWVFADFFEFHSSKVIISLFNKIFNFFYLTWHEILKISKNLQK